MLRYSAILGSTGVSAGAFGAHALKKMLGSDPNHRLSSLQDNWRTAVQYQLFHAAALLALSSLAHSFQQQELFGGKRNSTSMESSRDTNNCKKALDRVETGGKMMFYGTTLFSGSIFFLSLGIGPRKILGPITPIGGLLMIGGWIVVGMISIS